MLFAVAALLILSAPDETIGYTISFDNAVHHEARVTIDFEQLPEGPLDIVMSRSSPGRYAIHDFAKNVYALTAEDGKGKSLVVTRRTPHEWRVVDHDGRARVSYTLFADQIDGTYAAVDETHAHLNMPATFAWGRGLEDRPIRLKVDMGKLDWRVATQLVPDKKKNVFTAPNLYYFLDSPVECSAHELLEWEVDWAEGHPTVAMALHHGGTEEEGRIFFEMTKRVVAEQAGVFGELPPFDFDRYVFLADYLSYADGDGMEHRNSTILTSSSTLEDSIGRLLGTVSHEFFHAWNMERIRAKAIEPFDFEGPNMSEELWFGEGFTSYYDGLTIHRAGLTSIDDYAANLSGAINALSNKPGRGIRSAADMSRLATFSDHATSVDATNFGNTFISYYTYGDGIALGLDLWLRTKFDTTLDAFMRGMWGSHGKPEVPYTQDDLGRVLGEVSGSIYFAKAFFERYVNGREMMDYVGLLEHTGFLVRKANGGKANFSTAIRFEEGEAMVDGFPLIGSALYDAGLEKGTKILELGEEPLNSQETLESILSAHEPGDAVHISFERRGETFDTEVKLLEDPTLEVVPYEHAGLAVTGAMMTLRESWLGSKRRRDVDGLQKTCSVCRREYALSDAFCAVDGEELEWHLADGVLQ